MFLRYVKHFIPAQQKKEIVFVLSRNFNNSLLQHHLNLLKDPSNYKTCTAEKLLESLSYLAHTHKNEHNLIYLNDQELKAGLKGFLDLITTFHKGRILLLVNYLIALQCFDDDLWSTIEKIVIKYHWREFTSKQINSFIFVYSRSKRKNEELWALLETAVLYKFRTKDEFTCDQSVNILSNFIYKNRKNKELYDFLINLAAKNIKHISVQELSKLSYIMHHIGEISPDLLNNMLQQGLNLEETMTGHGFSGLLTLGIRFNASRDKIKKAEEIGIKKFQEMNLFNYAKLSFYYSSAYSDDLINKEERFYFLNELRKYFSIHGKDILANSVSINSGSFYLILMWGFYKANCIEDLEIFKDFASNLHRLKHIKNQDLHMLNDLISFFEQNKLSYIKSDNS